MSSLPTKTKKKGQLLLDHIKKNPEIISWDEKGNVKIRGKDIYNMHIIDVVQKLVNKRNVGISNLHLFTQALHDWNTPKSYYNISSNAPTSLLIKINSSYYYRKHF